MKFKKKKVWLIGDLIIFLHGISLKIISKKSYPDMIIKLIFIMYLSRLV